MALVAQAWTAALLRRGRQCTVGVVSAPARSEPLATPAGHPAIERLLVQATRDVQLLAALTPTNAAEERARLVLALRAGRAARPAWRYAPVAHDGLRRALEAAEHSVEAGEIETPLPGETCARLRELSVEAALCAAAGTPGVESLARERFAGAPGGAEIEASTIAQSWCGAPEDDAAAERLASDDPDPRSLLSRLRAEIGRRRLPFAVVIKPSLAPLAATGDGVILVAPGRATTVQDVERTVLHEIEGHAEPRARARTAPLALLRVGTARGVDDQEGYALFLEETHGFLVGARRRALAARHLTALRMRDGASFDDATRALLRDHGLDAETAIVVAERVYRGGDGVTEGLGRERVYLESFVRVRKHLAADPDDAAVLSAGQVALDAVSAVRPWLPAGLTFRPTDRATGRRDEATRPTEA